MLRQRRSATSTAGADIGKTASPNTVKPSKQLIAAIAAAALLVALGVAVPFWTYAKIDEAAALRDGAEVAFCPPVTGG